MSDDPFRLYALDLTLKRSGQEDNYILLDTRSLPAPGYHRFLKQRYGERWPGLGHQRDLKETIDPLALVTLIEYIARSNQVYYLHPSFGYYFERFHLKPHGLVYEMKLLATNEVAGPALTARELQENDDLWKTLVADKLGPLQQNIQKQLQSRDTGRDATALYIGGMYSRALNFLGVEAQIAENREMAADYFYRALAFNTNNPSAFINLDYNRMLREGQRDNPEPSEGVRQRLRAYGGNWDRILGVNGPVDEPYSCFLLAQALARGRNYRQAAKNLLRTIHYLPDNLVARLALANAYVRSALPDKAFEITAAIRRENEGKKLPVPDEVSLIQAEAYAHSAKNDLPTAVKILTTAQQQYPEQEIPFSTLAEIYLVYRQVTNAMEVLERQLKLQPENVAALNNLGNLFMRLGEYEQGLPYLTRALALDPRQPEALRNRAIAHLQLNKWDAAQADYEMLKNTLPEPRYDVAYGLGEVAFQKKQVRTALRHFNEFLRLAPPGVPEAEQVRQRIKMLKSGKF
jgi:tetratricopeptide (TPR) repeat protein